jgi:hypothetical protein
VALAQCGLATSIITRGDSPMEWDTLSRIMRWYVFFLIVTAVIYALLSRWQYGLHYAIDTMTLRGRIPDPTDQEIVWWFWRGMFLVVEDVASLFVFVLLGFGIGWLGKAVEESGAKGEYNAELRTNDELPTFTEWLRQRDPELFNYLTRPQIPNPPVPQFISFRAWLRRRNNR